MRPATARTRRRPSRPPATTWYLAEGSTSGDFALFYLLQNPGDVAAVGVRAVPAAGAAGADHEAPTPSRRTRVSRFRSMRIPELASTDVSGVVTATQPIVVERAMYLNRPGQPFAAGHGSAGVTAPATRWFLAEGATGIVLRSLRADREPDARRPRRSASTTCCPAAARLSKDYAVAAESRFTICVDDEQLPAGSGQRPLASTARRHAGHVDQRRAHHRRAVDVVAPAGLVRGAQRAGTTVTGTRWAMAEASSAVPSRPRPTC